MNLVTFFANFAPFYEQFEVSVDGALNILKWHCHSKYTFQELGTENTNTNGVKVNADSFS